MQIKNGKMWEKISEGQIQIEIRNLSLADLDGALEVLYKSFFINECVCNACGINLLQNAQARAELRDLCRITAEDGVSLVAIDTNSGAIVGVAFNKIQFVPENNEDPFFVKFRKEMTHSLQAQALMDFMIDVDGETDVFKLYQIDCVCELMFLAILPEWECKGIGRALAKYTIALTQDMLHGIGLEDINPKLRFRRPRAVTALFTSDFSQRVGKSQGFQVINTVEYSSFNNKGSVFDYTRIDPKHKSCTHVIFVI